MSERSDEVETIETEMLWGALSSDVMEPLGAPAAVASVLLRPSSIPVELMEQMHALIPVEVLPKEGDTPGSLAARLSENQYLHPNLGDAWSRASCAVEAIRLVTGF